MNDSTRKQLDALIGKFDTAMLVTTSLQGLPRARPMAIAASRPGGELYFATRADDEKLAEILASPLVAVTMQDHDRYLSVTGEARADMDNALAEELWSPTMRLWFPGGADDPELALIHVQPSYAEYWDRTGTRGLEFFLEAGRALLKGEKANDAALSGHAKMRADAGPQTAS